MRIIGRRLIIHPSFPRVFPPSQKSGILVFRGGVWWGRPGFSSGAGVFVVDLFSDIIKDDGEPRADREGHENEEESQHD